MKIFSPVSFLSYSFLTVSGQSLCGWLPTCTLSQIPTCLWNGNYQILPGFPICSIDSPLPKVGDLRNLWSYVFCKGVQMSTVADHLDNASYLKPNTHMSVKWKLSNSPWIPHLQYRLPIAQSWRLTESVKLCVLQGRTDVYSSWSFGQCWIQYHCQEFSLRINVYYQSRENISPNGHHSCNVVTFFI